jgi:hypothetical protein
MREANISIPNSCVRSTCATGVFVHVQLKVPRIRNGRSIQINVIIKHYLAGPNLFSLPSIALAQMVRLFTGHLRTCGAVSLLVGIMD